LKLFVSGGRSDGDDLLDGLSLLKYDKLKSDFAGQTMSHSHKKGICSLYVLEFDAGQRYSVGIRRLTDYESD